MTGSEAFFAIQGELGKEPGTLLLASPRVVVALAELLNPQGACLRCHDRGRWTMVAPGRRETFCSNCGKHLDAGDRP